MGYIFDVEPSHLEGLGKLHEASFVGPHFVSGETVSFRVDRNQVGESAQPLQAGAFFRTQLRLVEEEECQVYEFFVGVWSALGGGFLAAAGWLRGRQQAEATHELLFDDRVPLLDAGVGVARGVCDFYPKVDAVLDFSARGLTHWAEDSLVLSRLQAGLFSEFIPEDCLRKRRLACSSPSDYQKVQSHRSVDSPRELAFKVLDSRALDSGV